MAYTTYQEPEVFFESSSDFLDYLENTPFAPNWAKHEGEGARAPCSQTWGNKPSDSWDDNCGYEQAIEFAKNGWPKGTKLLSEQLELERMEGATPRRIHDVGGDFPDVGRYLAGLPDCMTRRIIRQGHRRPIITIEIGCTFSADVQSQNIMYLGAGVATLVDTLETMGFRVAVNVYWRTVTSGGTPCTTVQVKKPDQALNMSDLIFFLAHPAALRRLAFHHWETIYGGDEWDGGYGKPRAKKYSKEQEEDHNFIYFDDLNSAVFTMRSTKQAVEYVEKVVREKSPELFSHHEKPPEAV